MHLKSLEITGFKSFAKKTQLDFKTPITAIVGPNGSGKSNVAEAFRFVLGEQSIKSLRGKKTEDLIFNGTEEMGRGNRASVKVTFDNSRRLLNIDFDEVVLERVIYRDSSSEYLINGSQVRLKDIIELLAGAHIGSSGHHIISQGEADKILNASLKERREMIEDALGLKIYQYKKQESERKLERTEENIKQVESLRREIAPHLKFLKKQVEKIEKALEMKELLKTLYRDYLKREDTYLKETKKRLVAEAREPQVRLEKLKQELAHANEVLARSAHKDKKSEELVALESELKKLREVKENLSREIGRFEGEIESLKRIAKKQQELKEAEGSELVPLSGVIELETSIESEIKAALLGDPEALKRALTKVKELLRSFIEKHKKQGNKQTVETEAEIKELEAKRGGLLSQIGGHESREKQIMSDYARLKQEIEAEKDSSRDAEKAVFRIRAEQNEAETTLNLIRAKETTLHVEEGNFRRELEEGAVLIGRQVLDFESAMLTDENGQPVSIESVLSETREAQDERRRAIEKIKIRLEDAGAGGGEEVMKEFKEASERDQFLERELADLDKSAESLTTLIKDLEMRLDVEFKEGVKKINAEFQNFFTLMFGGGHASLEVVKEARRRKADTDLASLMEAEMAEVGAEPETDEGQEGIDIQVSLPRKKIKGLVMLSGGERALTSIALLFAVSQVNPPPFIVLDETDAALDEANSRKYGDMIANLAKYSQLILITHNRETMSRAGVLYGVTMGSGGVSKLLSIQFEEAVAVAK